eukprot:Skav236538  [mRNA]  locus=scaffold1774:62199:63929:+ [translate_table: standard]
MRSTNIHFPASSAAGAFAAGGKDRYYSETSLDASTALECGALPARRLWKTLEDFGGQKGQKGQKSKVKSLRQSSKRLRGCRPECFLEVALALAQLSAKQQLQMKDLKVELCAKGARAACSSHCHSSALPQLRSTRQCKVLQSTTKYYNEQRETARGSQKQQEAPTSRQKQPEAAKSSRKQPEAARSSQKQPKAAGSSQKQPEAAKSSQKENQKQAKPRLQDI